MIVFLDTEFTDFIDCDLISIGLVTDCGTHQFYAERTDYETAWCSSFAIYDVIPLLGRNKRAQKTRAQLHASLWRWFNRLGDVHIAYDYANDWDLLMDALVDFEHVKRPSNIIGRIDLRAYMFDPEYTRAMNRFYSRHKPHHHALVDAKAHRAGWLAWRAVHTDVA